MTSNLCWMAIKPESIKEFPRDLWPYWPYSYDLRVSCDVIFKGRQVLIPESMHADVLSPLHLGHFRVGKTRRRARNSVYWPKLNKDIAKFVGTCQACQESHTLQQKELFEPHKIPIIPETELGTDLFEVTGEDFLIILDFQPNHLVVHKLTSPPSAWVAQITASTFSLRGVPAEIVSDNDL